MKINYKILLIGYSNLARKRLVKVFLKKKIPFSVASKSYKKKIKGAYEQYDNYSNALKLSKADIVYLSLPNSLHYFWAKKVLEAGFHLIVDKPITTNPGEVKKLINLAKKKKLMVTEATFFNYHKQFSYIKRFCGKIENINQIYANFTIPMPKNNSLLLSKKFKGGAKMDMGPYAAAISRIFFHENFKKKLILVKKNNYGLVTSFDIFLKYKTKVFVGIFRFGNDYKNNLLINLTDKSIEVNRVFSPPDDIKLEIKLIKNKKHKIFKIKKDNCFENFLLEVINNLKKKNYDFYNSRMLEDESFRLKLIK